MKTQTRLFQKVGFVEVNLSLNLERVRLPEIDRDHLATLNTKPLSGQSRLGKMHLSSDPNL